MDHVTIPQGFSSQGLSTLKPSKTETKILLFPNNEERFGNVIKCCFVFLGEQTGELRFNMKYFL